MVACMLPTVAFAADTGKAIRLVNTNNPTGGILGYKNNNNSYDYIYMGSYNSSPVKWRVLDDQTNTGATGLFLLSEDLLGSGGHGDVYDVYFDGTSPYSNAWQGSDAQGWCNTFESSNLDSRELAAILSTTKSDEAFTSSTHNASFAASTNILNSDQVFFLSAQEAENGQYGFTDEAARVANYGAYASVWWLRSPFAKFTSSAGAVDGFGRVYDCGVGIVWAARPAFNLNLNSVLFTSAAVGGKPDGGLTAVPEYSGNEWKLTLLDSSRNFAVTEKAVSADPNDTITLNYSGATTGANEYISAIIADSSGAQYYGRVAQPTAESGTVEIKIPSDIAPGNYTLKVFSEQYNGDYKTDYASNFTDIALTVEKQVEEQFSLTPGGRYYFDLSAMKIPGTANGDLPDSTLHYVPFTYAGTVDAYKLTSEMATTEEYAQREKYPHSLFVADYAVTLKVNWNNLDTASLIFGKNYASGGVDYTLRAPSVGSDFTGSDDSQRGEPQSNEWDTMLNKNSGYIQNWNKMYSWGQDTFSGNASGRAVRGYLSARFWSYTYATTSTPNLGFRPVLEVLNADTLGSDGMKVVPLDLGGGTLGNSSKDIQIIVKTGSEFTAPASDGLTRPDGDTGSYFMWLGSDGKLYAPGASVPADVTKLTAQFALSEQFSLTPGGTYYFDLSAMGIPGTVNDALPDNTLHYVPFTYAGTVDAYKLMSEMATTEEYAQQKKYPHSLFVADYVVTHTVSWNDLDTESLIFGKDYVAGSVDYTLRAPSVGSSYTGSGDSERGTPKSNEWDKILDKDDGYIKNWGKMLSCGQDTTIRISASFRAVRGWKRSARFWTSYNTSYQTFGFRPVLEVPNPGTLGADGLKAVTLNLGGGKLGGSSDAIHIIVKNGSAFTAPASDGMTRPAGDTGSYFMWLDSNGNSYAPGDSVPADVTELTVQWTAPTYTVTLHANGGTINNGNVTEYTYGVGATLPTDVTRTGYTFKGWYYNENLTGSPVTAIGDTETGNKEYWAKWEINQYTISFDTNGGSEIAPITQDYGTKITAPADPTRKGYTFKGWDKEIPKTMPAENMTVKAQWEINQYAITFDTNGGSEIAPITQDYGTNITAPANPTREGYTFIGWDRDIPVTMPAENITITAQWEINRYTITFDTAGGSEIAPITQDYGTNITAPADPTREGYTFIGWDKAIPTTMPAENITVTAQWKDSEKPTGEIKINENSWKAFLNNITFGLFFKDTQTVTINAADNSGETVTVEYLLSDKELTKAELDGMTFTAYTAPFGIDPDNEYIIYVRLTDNAGNTDYICSDGIVLDGTSPVITGIEDGKTYCEAQTVTITEKYVDTVTVNGTAVTLDATGSFVLSPADGEQKIVVTDKACNTAEMTVTVNDGHTFGEWTSNGDGTHTRQCTADGCTEGIETDNCTDEDKNHICDICGNIISNHEDANQDHVCDLCGKVISNHEDADKDHVCDHCGKVISNHEDANKDHVCDYCEKVISNHEDADKDHICDLCGKTISNHEDADNNHICDYCGKTISNHEDADKDHVCDYCGKVITNHIGGKETCRDKAVCEVCGKSYGKLDPNNHTDLKHFPAKAATEDADGNIEYWYCSGCNKYYSDKDGTKEIAKADTVTAKLKDDSKSPQTGDTSNLALWIALLFVSGGVLTGVTVFDKRKRHSVK